MNTSPMCDTITRVISWIFILLMPLVGPHDNYILCASLCRPHVRVVTCLDVNLLRATSYTRLRACDHYISSILIGGNNGAGPSLLHTTLENRRPSYLQMSRLRLRNNQLKFKAFNIITIYVEQTIYIFNKVVPTREETCMNGTKLDE